MTFSRRRFLTIAAAFAASPAAAQRHSWHGRALGAEVSIVLMGPSQLAATTLATAREMIAGIEKQFSLFDPMSAISRLNRDKSLRPAPQFFDLVTKADKAVQLTGGLFDPTVQPLWKAVQQGRSTQEEQAAIGWDRVKFSQNAITIGTNQALTFNGIAQGFATDTIADFLAAQGWHNALINIGEHRSTGGHWRLALEDTSHGVLGIRTLEAGAIATSSPAAMPIGKTGHILHATARPQWSTVSVEAHTATVADAYSTALTLAPLKDVREIKAKAGLHRVTLVATNGDLITV